MELFIPADLIKAILAAITLLVLMVSYGRLSESPKGKLLLGIFVLFAWFGIFSLIRAVWQ